MTDHAADLSRWFPKDAAFAAMHAHRIVKVTGADAAALLQGQLSNDITLLDANPGQLSSFNSPKGRVLAFLRVLKFDDGFRLVVDADILDAFAQRLRMFVLRSKVSIDVAGDIRATVLLGAEAPSALAAAELPAPAPGHAVRHGAHVLLGVPGPLPRIEIFGTDAPALDAVEADAAELARWDVLYRLPRINDANRDQHVAQHLGLDELEAISFKKGCYTGQEIIARMKYLGRVKKRPFVLEGAGAPGDTVRDENGSSAGEIVNAAGNLLLAVLNLDAIGKSLRVNDAPVRVLG